MKLGAKSKNATAAQMAGNPALAARIAAASKRSLRKGNTAWKSAAPVISLDSDDEEADKPTYGGNVVAGEVDKDKNGDFHRLVLSEQNGYMWVKVGKDWDKGCVVTIDGVKARIRGLARRVKPPPVAMATLATADTACGEIDLKLDYNP
jgi:hypothetical protein